MMMSKILVLFSAACEAAFAQCSMCRTALAGQGPGATHALNTAIVILLVPAVGLFSGAFLLLFHFQNPAGSEESKDEKECKKTF